MRPFTANALGALIMIFSLFKANATPEQDFWNWFQKNEDSLFSFEKNRDVVFGKLKKEMTKVHESLTFEFGPVKDGKREFIISADGNKKAFPSVEKLHAAAPQLKRWDFIKFRQRREPMDIEYGGIKVKAEDIRCTVEPDSGKAGITLFIRGYEQKNKQTYVGVAFLMLDQALGEYDVETKVGFIQVKPDTEELKLQRKPLKELPQIFDEFWKHWAVGSQSSQTNSPSPKP